MTAKDATLGEKTRAKLKRVEYSGLATSAFIIGTATIGLTLLAQSVLPPEIPLFYGNAEGTDQLANKLALVLPGSITLVFLLVNIALSIATKDVFIKRILIFSGFALSILSIITTVQIIFLVGKI